MLAGERIQPYYLVLRDVMRTVATGGCVVKGDCPQVVLTEHPFADGTSAVVAINCEPRALTCPITLRGRLGRVWRGAVSAADGSGAIRLAPNEAAVFEVVR